MMSLAMLMTFGVFAMSDDQPMIRLTTINNPAATIVNGSRKEETVKVCVSPTFPNTTVKARNHRKDAFEIGGYVISPPQGGFDCEDDMDYDVVVGMDFLRDKVLGFDIYAKELLIWPSNQNSQDNVGRWFGELPSWSSSSTLKPSAISGKKTRMGVELPIGDNGAWAKVLLGYYSTSLDKSLRGPLDETLPSGSAGTLTDKVKVGDTVLPWVMYLSPSQLGQARGRLGNAIGLLIFRSRRVAVDFGQAKVYFEKLPEDLRISIMLAEFFWLPFWVEGTKIYLQSRPGISDLDLGQAEGGEVLQIADMSAVQVLSLLRDPKPAKILDVIRLVRQRSGVDIRVRTKSGQEIVVSPVRGKSS